MIVIRCTARLYSLEKAGAANAASAAAAAATPGKGVKGFFALLYLTMRAKPLGLLFFHT